jgi:hypothetical protein
MSDRLRVAIVGLGMAHKPHLQSLRELGDIAEIAACHAPSPARRAEFGQANPDLPLAADLDEVLRDESIDAIIVLTPPPLTSTSSSAARRPASTYFWRSLFGRAGPTGRRGDEPGEARFRNRAAASLPGRRAGIAGAR